jgi:hypothetical protein
MSVTGLDLCRHGRLQTGDEGREDFIQEAISR